MLRTSSPVRTLGLGDVQHAMQVCARDPVTNVFVAARILEGGLSSGRVTVLGYDRAGERGLCWTGANIVPVECSAPMVEAFADKVARRRRSASSLCGPAEAVLHLWSRLEPSWGPPREVRAVQPVLTMAARPSLAGIEPDRLVRPAGPEELDLVVPAAAAMFTEEIGYPPFRGSDRAYRGAVAQLIRDRRTLVRVEQGEVVFKADIGSAALGVAQIQGVWVHPALRGQGLAVPAMAAVVEYTLRHVAPTVTLYVNDYNAPALATYRRVGFVRTGTFATVLL